MDILFRTSTVSSDPLTGQDGDVACAMSREQTQRVTARNICDHHKVEFLTSGLRSSDPLVIGYLEQIYKYRMSRDGDRAQRTNLQTGVVDWIGSTPNEQGEHIYVAEFIQRRLRHVGHRIFGETGSEIWYGGGRKQPDIDWDAIWNNIETHSDYRRANFQDWEFSSLERCHFGVCNCRGFRHDQSCEISNGTCIEHGGPLYDEEGTLLRKARWVVPYWDVATIDTEQTRDKDQEYDARQVGDDREILDDVIVEAI